MVLLGVEPKKLKEFGMYSLYSVVYYTIHFTHTLRFSSLRDKMSRSAGDIIKHTFKEVV